jgi:hypothetical protein
VRAAFEEAWRFLDAHVRDLAEAILGTGELPGHP